MNDNNNDKKFNPYKNKSNPFPHKKTKTRTNKIPKTKKYNQRLQIVLLCIFLYGHYFCYNPEILDTILRI